MEEHLIKRLSLEELDEKMLRRAYRDVDFKTALIRLNGKRYQASQSLAGQKKVQLRWPFDDESAVTIWRNGECYAQNTGAVFEKNICAGSRY